MTLSSEEREWLRLKVHLARSHEVNRQIREYGLADCDWCGDPIQDQRPGKKFCSTRCCRLSHWAARDRSKVAA